MRQALFTIESNAPVAAGVWRMALHGDTSAIAAPGQFVNLQLPGRYLRRPISVCDVDGDVLTLVYKVVGAGTDQLSRMRPGEMLDALTGLGNGYDLAPAGARPVLVGGGVGVPPLYLLARRLIERGVRPDVRLGFNAESEVFFEDEFRALGCDVRVATLDGSRGAKGFVTDILPDAPTHYYACGPMPMLRAVWNALACSGQLSFEARMGCGFGACMGCTMRTVDGYARVCADGPVLRKEEIAWDD